MDYKGISLHSNLHGYPADQLVMEKYPSKWRNEDNINALLLSSLGDTWECRGLERTNTWNENTGLRCGVNDKIVLLLNLDAGTLSMHKNGIYVGELCSGLEGEYLWVGCYDDIVGGSQCTSISISDWE